MFQNATEAYIKVHRVVAWSRSNSRMERHLAYRFQSLVINIRMDEER
jgi:hypothetical protein